MSDSDGMNAMVSSGEASYPDQYSRAARAVDVRPERLDVLRDELVAPCALGAGGSRRDLRRLQVGAEGNLGVDGDRLAAGQVHDHVGSSGAGRRGDGGLHVEVHAFEQPGRLDHVPQLGLAPDAPRAVRGQGARERVGGGAQPFLGLGGGPELCGERAVLLAAGLLELGDLGAHHVEGLRDGAQRREHLRLALLARRVHPVHPLQQVLEFGGPAFERVDLPPVLGVLRVEPLLGVGADRVELRAQRVGRRMCGGGVDAGPGAGERPGDDGADGDAEHETDDQREDLHDATVAVPTDTVPPGRRCGVTNLSRSM